MSLFARLDNVHQIFLDTAPVIYYVEKNPSFAPILQPVFGRLDEGNLIAVISPITLAECLVLPYRLGETKVAEDFIELLVNSQSVLFYPLDETTANKAADLRARYNLTLTDAFQIATAILTGCEAFLTNDVELKRVTELPVLIISE